MIIYEDIVWVLMDANKRLIAKGVPRNRTLVFVDDPKDKKRILTYRSEATAAANSRGFWMWGDAREYAIKTYGIDPFGQPDLYPVRVKVTYNVQPEQTEE